MDSATFETSVDMPDTEEKEGLPVEAFAKVQEIFSNVDWIDSKSDVALNVLQKISSSKVLKEKLEIAAEKNSLESGSGKLEDDLKTLVLEGSVLGSPLGTLEKQSERSSEPTLDTNLVSFKSDAYKEGVSNIVLDNWKRTSLTEESSGTTVSNAQQLDKKGASEANENKKASMSMVFEKLSKKSSGPSLDANMIVKKAQPEDLLSALQQTTQTKIISPRILQSSRSSSALYNNSVQGSPKPMQRFHSSPSSLGITALLHDHDTYKSDMAALLGATAQQPLATSVSFVPEVPKTEQNALSPSVQPQPLASPPPPAPLQYAHPESLQIEPFRVDTSSPLPLSRLSLIHI